MRCLQVKRERLREALDAARGDGEPDYAGHGTRFHASTYGAVTLMPLDNSEVLTRGAAAGDRQHG